MTNGERPHLWRCWLTCTVFHTTADINKLTWDPKKKHLFLWMTASVKGEHPACLGQRCFAPCGPDGCCDGSVKFIHVRRMYIGWLSGKSRQTVQQKVQCIMHLTPSTIEMFEHADVAKTMQWQWDLSLFYIPARSERAVMGELICFPWLNVPHAWLKCYHLNERLPHSISKWSGEES